MDIETLDIKKAMAYDLIKIFESTPNKTYTAKEVETLIYAYIVGTGTDLQFSE